MDIQFDKIAPYLQDPLILIGFFLFLGFVFARGVVTAGIIPQLTKASGYRVLQRILLYGFVTGLAVIALGFGLKYRELSKHEQANAVRLLDQELTDDGAVLAELKSNTQTILNATTTVSQVLRTPGIKLLAGMFPAENLDPAKTVPASADYAGQLLDQLEETGLASDKVEQRKFLLAARAISGTIERTASTIRSLADVEGTRYIMKSQVWSTQLPILRQVSIIDVTQFQATYAQLELARANYNVVVRDCIGYLSAIDKFFNAPDQKVTKQSLADVLAAERLYVEIVSAYSKKLVENITETGGLDRAIRAKVSQL